MSNVVPFGPTILTGSLKFTEEQRAALTAFGLSRPRWTAKFDADEDGDEYFSLADDRLGSYDSIMVIVERDGRLSAWYWLEDHLGTFRDVRDVVAALAPVVPI